MATVTARPLPFPRATVLRLPILDAYLLREFIPPFLISFGGFFVFWALNILYLAADYIINYHAPFFLVMRFIVFRMPQAVPMAFPFATLFGTLLALGRLMGDNEINAMRTSGVPLLRFALTPLLFGIAMFLLAYLTNEFISPPAVDLSTRTFYQIIYRTESLPVEPQFFRKDADTGNVFYVTSVSPDNKTMLGVQVFRPGRTGYWNETIQAQTATIDGAVIVLRDAIMTRYNNAGIEVAQNRDKEYRIGLPLAETAAQFMTSVNSDPWTMSSKALSSQIHSLEAQGIGGTTLGNLQINLANKLAWPFACVVGVVLALPLAIRFGRRGRLTGFALAFLAFFLYYVLNSAGNALGHSGAINPYIAAWIPNVLMGTAGVVLLWLEEH